MVASDIGKNIKRALKAAGKTQTWLAEQLSVSDNAVSKWIKSGKISRENAMEVAAALKVPIATILSTDDDFEFLGVRESSPPYSDERQRLLAQWEQLGTEQRAALMEQIDTQVAKNMALVRELAPRMKEGTTRRRVIEDKPLEQPKAGGKRGAK